MSVCTNEEADVEDGGLAGGSGAPTTARYWLGNATDVSGLSAEHLVGALADGILKHTAGTPALAVAGTDYEVPLTFTGALARTVNSVNLAAIAGASILANVTGGSAVPSVLTGSGDQVLRTSSGVLGFGGINGAHINTNQVTYNKLQQGSALSVLGVTGNAVANLADIVAGTDGHAFRRSGTSVGFGTLAAGAFAGTQTDGFVLTLSSGVPTWLVASGGGTIDGSGAANRIAIWSDADTLTSNAGFTLASDILTYSAAASGLPVSLLISNTSNTASASADIEARVAGATAANPTLRTQISGLRTFDFYIDNADGDDPKIARDSDVRLKFLASGVNLMNRTGAFTLGYALEVYGTASGKAMMGTVSASVSQQSGFVAHNTNGAFMEFVYAGSSGTGYGNFLGTATTNQGCIKGNSSGGIKVGTTAAATLALGTNDIQRLEITSDGSIGLFNTGAGSYGSGVKVLFVANATTAPSTNPTGGGILYCASGALWYRGSSGTVTQIAVA